MTLPIQSSMNPASQMAAGLEAKPSYRTGQVIAVEALGVQVNVAGGVVYAAYLDSYSPAVGDSVGLMAQGDSWVILGRIIGVGTPEAAGRTAATGPSILDGLYTIGNAVTLASSTGGGVTVPRYRVTYFHPINHSVQIVAKMSVIASGATDTMLITMQEDASSAGAIAVGQDIFIFSVAAAGRTALVYGLVTPTFGGRIVSVRVDMARFSGAGTVSVEHQPTRPGFIYALDMGDTATFSGA